ncbi:citrate (Si)-synthase [Saccharicrinis sp. FJH62]|uniref:citrate (Si)-synthase n=1 Tax=Saccharicrinis sp. FJH62 TaxID=3344657 RepID=UPI0035D4001C
MKEIKAKLHQKGLEKAEILKKILKDHGDVELQKVTIAHALTGMKGIVSLLTDTSKLDPESGIRFRGYSIPELKEVLPKIKPDGEPLPEGLFYLMLMDELPTKEDVKKISQDWSRRAKDIPHYVFDVINALPKDAHPMIQLNTAILAMSKQSHFRKAYDDGMDKKDFWDPMFEGVMDLIARLPVIAAYIYRRVFHQEKYIDIDPSLDWAGNLAHMMGYESEEVKRLMRLYMVIHADHEGGNVSAHTTHLVGSALSNPYYSFAAGMNGLAGPLHGMANQDVMHWINKLLSWADTCCPTKDQIREFAHITLDSGNVIPGYGHAVLRQTDPRFTVQLEFAKKYKPDAQYIKVVSDIYDVVPDVLRETGKVKNPWPNVDAISGSLLTSYGITEQQIYTVLFGVSRSLGVLASLVWDRLYGFGIERPKSQPLSFFMEKAGIK